MCGPSAVRLAPLVRAEARRNLLHPVALVAVIAAESRCRSGVVNPVSGSIGLLQILPGGSADGGYPPDELRADDLNVRLGAAHLGRLLAFCGAWSGALSVFSGFRYCRSTRYSRRVQALERDFLRWLRGEEARTS
jgi:soluble lytic murein transglycosylase-like protein